MHKPWRGCVHYVVACVDTVHGQGHVLGTLHRGKNKIRSERFEPRSLSLNKLVVYQRGKYSSGTLEWVHLLHSFNTSHSYRDAQDVKTFPDVTSSAIATDDQGPGKAITLMQSMLFLL